MATLEKGIAFSRLPNTNLIRGTYDGKYTVMIDSGVSDEAVTAELRRMFAQGKSAPIPHDAATRGFPEPVVHAKMA